MADQLSTMRVALLEPQPLLAERVRALLHEVGATPVGFDESPDLVLAVADAPVAGWTDAVSAARASFDGTFVWSWFGPATQDDGVHLPRPFDAAALSEALRRALLSSDSPSGASVDDASNDEAERVDATRPASLADPVVVISSRVDDWAALSGDARRRAVAATLRDLGLLA